MSKNTTDMESVMRFRIRAWDQQIVHKSDTLQQAIDWLLKQDMGLNRFMVEDLQDDTEVDADEILEAYRNGERYEDLQGF